jgi:hypothetical protein
MKKELVIEGLLLAPIMLKKEWVAKFTPFSKKKT